LKYVGKTGEAALSDRLIFSVRAYYINNPNSYINNSNSEINNSSNNQSNEELGRNALRELIQIYLSDYLFAEQAEELVIEYIP
jgi:hypothetical protein